MLTSPIHTNSYATLLETVKQSTHTTCHLALEGGYFFFNQFFTSSSHAESSFVGASDMSQWTPVFKLRPT